MKSIIVLSLLLVFYYANAGVCRSTGDPHYRTFDGYTYNVYGWEGDFVLAKSARGNFEVQTRIQYGKHWGKKGLNRAVAVKADGNVIEHFGNYFLINGKKNARLSLKNGAKITRKGRRFYITSKSGDRVDFSYGSGRNGGNKRYAPYYFNIYVRPKKGKYFGLCGNNDGNRKNDIVVKQFKRYRISPKAHKDLFGKVYAPKHVPYKLRKYKWKSAAFKKAATKYCHLKLKLKGNLYIACLTDIKRSGKLRAGNMYKKAKELLRCVRKKKCVRRRRRCVRKKCSKYAYKTRRKCIKYKTTHRSGRCLRYQTKRYCAVKQSCTQNYFNSNNKRTRTRKSNKCLKYKKVFVYRTHRKCIAHHTKRYCALRQKCTDTYFNIKGKSVKRKGAGNKCLKWKAVKKGCRKFKTIRGKVCIKRKKGKKVRRCIKYKTTKRKTKCLRRKCTAYKSKCLKWKTFKHCPKPKPGTPPPPPPGAPKE